MRRAAIAAVALWAAVAGTTGMATAQGEAAAPAEPVVVPSEPVRTFDTDFSVNQLLEAKIDLGFGDVVLRGEEVDRIYVRLLIFCERKDLEKCQKAAGDVAVAGESDGQRISLRVKGVTDFWLRKLRFRFEVRIPRELAADVHVHKGQVRIDELVASTKVEVDDGTVDLNVPDSEVGELLLKAGGKVTVEGGGQSISVKGMISGELHWIRPGRFAKIEAKADIGDVRVVLR